MCIDKFNAFLHHFRNSIYNFNWFNLLFFTFFDIEGGKNGLSDLFSVQNNILHEEFHPELTFLLNFQIVRLLWVFLQWPSQMPCCKYDNPH